VSSTDCGVVKEIVIDSSFVDGFRARAKDGLCVVGNGGVVCAGLGGNGAPYISLYVSSLRMMPERLCFPLSLS